MKKNLIYGLMVLVASALLLFACSGGGGSGGSSNTPIDDSGLPPDPGKEGKLTIEGIDSDGDGVRDDVQRYIALTYEDEATRKALTRYAKVEQDFLLSADDKEAAIESANTRGKARRCLRLIYPFDEAYQILDETDSVITNTKERMRAYLSADLLLSGETFKSPSDDELVDFCK